eukprot:TRINITY_DN5694_c6_g1_i2.p2 TRINITY_DN5694_c6_g1~~TRINITY_DN5694_c6_g1_i2.p2  ORF type:complete len:327 (+),score=100.77 TRINITY_DN5694_c6_g1_i2:75-983(+)
MKRQQSLLQLGVTRSDPYAGLQLHSAPAQAPAPKRPRRGSAPPPGSAQLRIDAGQRDLGSCPRCGMLWQPGTEDAGRHARFCGRPPQLGGWGAADATRLPVQHPQQQPGASVLKVADAAAPTPFARRVLAALDALAGAALPVPSGLCAFLLVSGARELLGAALVEVLLPQRAARLAQGPSTEWLQGSPTPAASPGSASTPVRPPERPAPVAPPALQDAAPEPAAAAPEPPGEGQPAEAEPRPGALLAVVGLWTHSSLQGAARSSASETLLAAARQGAIHGYAVPAERVLLSGAAARVLAPAQ